ncbi:MAG TPA: SDR family NAD(P)-dependent oxidoreductase [Trebonia sp.]|nr:SDR family NAD(P)-dependent oxidoreductase [Trebonia sp.]
MSRTWFITGTSTGFGRELTGQLLARGDRVAATLRRPAALGGLAARYGAQLWVRELDVTRTAQVRDVVDAAFADLGRIDVVVSNAGYGLLGAAGELTDEQITDQIQANLIGSIQLVRAVLPHLRAQDGGRILPRRSPRSASAPAWWNPAAPAPTSPSAPGSKRRPWMNRRAPRPASSARGSMPSGPPASPATRPRSPRP